MSNETKTGGSPQWSRINIWRILRSGLACIATLALSMLAVSHSFADGGREIRIQDKCDPITFNAVLGAGACIGDGNVTIAQLVATLNPTDGGHDAWRFSREELAISVGEVVHITNAGGETHTFNEVRNFGTGIAGPPLDLALPPGTPAATPIGPPNFVSPGQRFDIRNLSTGSHQFQCLIHPWMRTVITVKSS